MTSLTAKELMYLIRWMFLPFEFTLPKSVEEKVPRLAWLWSHVVVLIISLGLFFAVIIFAVKQF